jgi:hypothetical protein
LWDRGILTLGYFKELFLGKRFGIGALAVAALIVAGPASAQLSAKPAVGTVIGVQSGTMMAFQAGGEMGLGPSQAPLFTTEVIFMMVGGVMTSTIIYNIVSDAEDPTSP